MIEFLFLRPQRDLYFDYDAEKSDITKEEDRRKIQARQSET